MRRSFLLAPLVWLTSLSTAQNNALDFDGQNDVASGFGASAYIAASPALSMTCWVYPRSAAPAYPDFDGLMGFRNEVDCDFYMVQIAPTNTIEGRFRNSAGTAFTVTAPALSIGQWQHMALVYDGSFLTLYHNGTVLANTPANGVVSNSSVPLLIGDVLFAATHFYLDGKIDEATVWTRALSGAEINCMMSAGFDPQDPDLQFYYRCDQGTAAGNNTSIVLLEDEQGNLDAALTGLSLISSTSNFVTGCPVPGSNVTSATICQGEAYLFNGNYYTAQGTYTSTFTTGSSCDSIVSLDLAVTAVNTYVGVVGVTLTATAGTATFQWLDCDNGNAIIPGATASSYTATANGDYAVQVTQNGCTDTSSCHTISGVGVPENADEGIAVRFDASPDVLAIDGASGGTATILDPHGRVVTIRSIAGTHDQLFLGTLSAGCYVVKVQRGDAVRALRFVKW